MSSQKVIKKITNTLTIVKETIDYNAGAVAYIISREYAEFLMKRFFPIKIPQDIMMGNYYRHGNHLSLKMKYNEKKECYISPLLKADCGGDWGTGVQSTQEHESPTIRKRWKCS
jgi:GR25 family glycosyltransferase involved in LPS biosynthesis